MRVVGECINRDLAERFADYLSTLQIASEVRPAKEKWSIWVYHEDELKQAGGEFVRYVGQPDDPAYIAAQKKAQVLRHESEKVAEAALSVARKALPRTAGPFLSIGLIAVSVAVSALLHFGGLGTSVMSALVCSPERVAAGELWRLVTPIFLHFGLFHILFNMMWLHHLGGMLEAKKGPRFLAMLVLIIAVASNLSQALVQGAQFGGMSGVVYGLFGYIWMKSKFEPFEGLLLDRSTIILMMFWFVAGMSGLLGGMANVAHGVGLTVGVAIGGFPSFVQSLRRTK